MNRLLDVIKTAPISSGYHLFVRIGLHNWYHFFEDSFICLHFYRTIKWCLWYSEAITGNRAQIRQYEINNPNADCMLNPMLLMLSLFCLPFRLRWYFMQTILGRWCSCHNGDPWEMPTLPASRMHAFAKPGLSGICMLKFIWNKYVYRWRSARLRVLHHVLCFPTMRLYISHNTVGDANDYYAEKLTSTSSHGIYTKLQEYPYSN